MMLASFEQTFTLQQRDANTKESKDTVLESDDFPLRRSPLLFDSRDLKIYEAAARRRGFITKDLFIQDNSRE